MLLIGLLLLVVLIWFLFSYATKVQGTYLNWQILFFQSLAFAFLGWLAYWLLILLIGLSVINAVVFSTLGLMAGIIYGYSSKSMFLEEPIKADYKAPWISFVVGHIDVSRVVKMMIAIFAFNAGGLLIVSPTSAFNNAVAMFGGVVFGELFGFMIAVDEKKTKENLKGIAK